MRDDLFYLKIKY